MFWVLIIKWYFNNEPNFNFLGETVATLWTLTSGRSNIFYEQVANASGRNSQPCNWQVSHILGESVASRQLQLSTNHQHLCQVNEFSDIKLSLLPAVEVRYPTCTRPVPDAIRKKTLRTKVTRLTRVGYQGVRSTGAGSKCNHSQHFKLWLNKYFKHNCFNYCMIRGW